MKKLTQEEFINRANEAHNFKYDYSKSVYINKRTGLTITCPKHGDFSQGAWGHLRGEGCRKCATERWIKARETPKEGKSFGDNYPHLLIDWSPNNKFSPFSIKSFSKKKVKWICSVCKTNYETSVSERAAGHGCKTCHNKKKYKGGKYLTGTQYYSVLKGAKQRKINFEITVEDIEEVYERQNKKCSITNINLVFCEKIDNKVVRGTASVDRIDSSKGYTKDNIQIVHKYINVAKRALPDKDFRLEFDKFIKECIKYYGTDQNSG